MKLIVARSAFQIIVAILAFRIIIPALLEAIRTIRSNKMSSPKPPSKTSSPASPYRTSLPSPPSMTSEPESPSIRSSPPKPDIWSPLNCNDQVIIFIRSVDRFSVQHRETHGNRGRLPILFGCSDEQLITSKVCIGRSPGTKR